MVTFDEAKQSLRRVREKYPQYSDLGDSELASRLADKYPEYSDIAETVQQPQQPDRPTVTEDPAAVVQRSLKGTPFAGRTEVTEGEVPGGDQVSPAIDFMQRYGQIKEREQELATGAREAIEAGLEEADRPTDVKAPLQDVPVLGEVSSGLTQAGLEQQSLIARTFQDPEISRRITDLSSQVARQDKGMLSKALSGAVRSLGTIAQQGTGGPIATIGRFTLDAVNRGMAEAHEAGLRGTDKVKFATGQGAIEGVVTAAFQRLGLGGLEQVVQRGLRGAAREGVKQALKRAGVQSLSELSEENIVEVGQAVHTALSGVDPDAVNPERLKDTIAQTSLTTLMTMGLTQGPQIVGEARANRRGRQTVEEAAETQEAAEQDRLIRQQKLGGGPGTAEEIATGRARQRLQQVRQEVQQPPDDTAQEMAEEQVAETPPRQPEVREETQQPPEPDLADLPKQPGVFEGPAQVAEFAAETDPDVRQDPKDEEQRRSTRDYIEGELRNLEGGEGEFALIDVPVDLVATRRDYQPQAVEQYAQQPAETQPAAVGGFDRQGEFIVVDGNSRVKAAVQRGDSTVPVYVPRDTANRLNDQIDEFDPVDLPLATDTTVGKLLSGVANQTLKNPVTKREASSEFADLARTLTNMLDKSVLNKPVSLIRHQAGKYSYGGPRGIRILSDHSKSPYVMVHEVIHVAALDRVHNELERVMPGADRKTGSAYRKALEAYINDPNADPAVSDLAQLYLETADFQSETGQRFADRLFKTKEGGARHARIRVARSESRPSHLPSVEDYPWTMQLHGDFPLRKAVAQLRKAGVTSAEMKPEPNLSNGPELYLSESAQQKVQEQLEVRPDAFGRETEFDVEMVQALKQPTLANKPQEVFRSRDMPYGMANLHEFLAEAFTDKDFQKTLASVPSEVRGKTGTLWDRLVDAVRRLIGLSASENSVLGQTLRTGADLMARPSVYEQGLPPTKKAPEGPIATQRPTARQQYESAEQTADEKPFGAQEKSPLGSISEITEATFGGEMRAIAGPNRPSKVREVISRVGVPMSTVVRHMSPRLYGRLKQMEARMMRRRHDLDSAIARDLKTMREQLGRDQARVALEIASTQGNSAATAFINENFEGKAASEAVEAFEDIITIKDAAFKEAQRSGVKSGFVEDHFPRQVKDYEAWIEYRYGEEPDELQRMVRQEAQKKGRKLTEQEKADLANRWAQGFGPRKPGQVKPRRLGRRTEENVTLDEFRRFYVDPEQSILTYIEKVVNAAEKAKVFGKGSDQETLEDSIGRLVDEGKYELDKLAGWQKRRLKDILNARFASGEAAPQTFLRWSRSLGYMTTLADPSAAAIQLGDMALTLARDNVVPTMKGMAGIATEKTMTAKNMGLERISQEFNTQGGINKWLDFGFTWSGFRKVDQVMKTSSMRSAFARAKSIAKDPDSKKFSQWAERYRPAFGQEQFDQLVHDLRTDSKSEVVLDYVYMELSRTQPIDLMEMPQSYAANPNGRIFYMLKTFTIKQFDLIRERSFDQIAEGVKNGDMKKAGGGLKNLVYMSMILSASYASVDWVRDWILGRNPDWPDSYINGLLGLFGAHTFLFQTAADKGLGTAVFDYLAPPLNWLDDASQDFVMFTDYLNGEGDYEGLRVLRNVPFSKILFWRFGKGVEWSASFERQEARDTAVKAYNEGDMNGVRAVLDHYNENAPAGKNISMMSIRRSAKQRRETR